MPLGKQIRSPAERSMNIHEKNAVCSRALCVRTDPGIPQFLFFGGGGEGVGRETGTRRRVSSLALSAKPAKPQTFAHSGAGPLGTERCQVQAHTLPAAARVEAPRASPNPSLEKIKCSEIAHRSVGRQCSYVRGCGFDPLRCASGGIV